MQKKHSIRIGHIYEYDQFPKVHAQRSINQCRFYPDGIEAVVEDIGGRLMHAQLIREDVKQIINYYFTAKE